MEWYGDEGDYNYYGNKENRVYDNGYYDEWMIFEMMSIPILLMILGCICMIILGFIGCLLVKRKMKYERRKDEGDIDGDQEY